MKILNLVYPEKSDIKYKVSKFPDGQQNIVIDPFIIDFCSNIRKRISCLKHGYPDSEANIFEDKELPCRILPVQIKSHLNNWLDLELIICAVASLRELGVEEIHLYTPYIMGARSDRKFEEGGNNYLKDVICPIINSLNFKTVTCIDPHSDVLEACIKGFRKIEQSKIVYDILGTDWATEKLKYNKFILISPDAGANKKIYKVAEQIRYKEDIITCSKDRDKDGKLTKTVVPLKAGEYLNKDFIIIDDICDGGRTFINIAKELRSKLNNYTKFNIEPKIYLIVTHSIFSKGTDELLKYFDGIYTTNSYKEHNIEKVKVLNIF